LSRPVREVAGLIAQKCGPGRAVLQADAFAILTTMENELS